MRRVVVKIGTSLLTTESGTFSHATHAKLCEQILKLSKTCHVTVVSSGAVALGMKTSGFKKRPKKMANLQACAAIGQGKLIHAYESYFSKRGRHTAQVLLTRDGLENRKRFLNARQTFDALFQRHVIPVVNENDTVSVEEIAFGDNDMLSVEVGHVISADLILNLSNVDGFRLSDGTRLQSVGSEKELQTLSEHLQDVQKEHTVGGMQAKLNAALFAMELGIPFQIIDGKKKNVLEKAVLGEDVGTRFACVGKSKSSRKKWIAFTAPKQGVLTLDEGAVKAIAKNKKSLLPGGILKVKGEFRKGQVVELEDENGAVFGLGVVKYQAKDLKKICGKKTAAAKKILGGNIDDEVVHRNDLVMMGDRGENNE